MRVRPAVLPALIALLGGCPLAGLHAQTIEMAALNLIGSSTDVPFPSTPFPGGYSHTFPVTTGTYTYTFENAYIGMSGSTAHPDWWGTGILTYTMNDANAASNAFHSVADRLTEYHDFNPGDIPNTSGRTYEVYGRGIFGFNGAGGGPAVEHDWTLTFDFSTLAPGYLPAGTVLGFTDIDGIAASNESILLSAVLHSGGTDPWMTFYDDAPNPAPGHGLAAYNALDNTYLFDGPPSSNDHIAYITTENLTGITFDITQSAGAGGSIGFKIIAPVPEPSAALLVIAALAGLTAQRRRQSLTPASSAGDPRCAAGCPGSP